MRDEREKRDGQEIRRTPPAHLAHRANPATLAFLASPASRAPCGRSSALSLTDPNRTHHTQYRARAKAPRLIQAGRVSTPFLSGLPTAPTVLHMQLHARDQ